MSKKILLVCVMSLWTVVAVRAEDIDFGLDDTAATLQSFDESVESAQDTTETATKQWSTLVEELHLTPQQRDKAKFLSDESRIKMEQLHNSMQQILKQVRELEDKNLNEFAEILTDEQKAKFYEFKSLRHDERQAHDGIIQDVVFPLTE